MKDQFLPGVIDNLGWYVYLLTDPRHNNEVFYVGKGTGGRCFAHIIEARQTRADVAHGYEKLARIRAIEAEGHVVGIDLLRHALTQDQAFLVESVAIELLGRDRLTNRVAGHDTAQSGRMSVAEVNARYGAHAVTIDPAHRIVIFQITNSYRPAMTEADIYEITRKWWQVSASRVNLSNPHAPVWAMGVCRGIVRGVYRIEAWEQPSPEEIAINPNNKGRWGFRGKPDPEMEARYLYGDVSHHLKKAQAVVRYFGC